MKITKEYNQLVMRIDLEQNSYDAIGELIDKVPNIIAVVDESDKQEHSISQLCDLGYKATQQEGMSIINFWQDKEGLLKVAKELEIPIWYKN
jgi:hypothetical protein